MRKSILVLAIIVVLGLLDYSQQAQAAPTVGSCQTVFASTTCISGLNVGDHISWSATNPELMRSAFCHGDVTDVSPTSISILILHDAGPQLRCGDNNIGITFNFQVIFLADRDGDKVPDINDNCPDDFNPDQEDIDFDRVGNDCDDLHHITFFDITNTEPFTVQVGQTLEVEPGISLTNLSTITNLGTINIPAGANLFNINGGLVDNNSGDTITISGNVVNFGEGTIFNNNSPGKIIINDGGAIVNLEALLSNNAGATIDVINGGLFTQDGGAFANSGDTNVQTNGALVNMQLDSNLFNDGNIATSGIFLTLGGAITVNAGSINADAGFVANDAALFSNDGGIVFNDTVIGLNVNGATFANNSLWGLNAGIFYNAPGNTVNNNSGAILIIQDAGAIWYNDCGAIFNGAGPLVGTITQLPCA